MLNTWSLNHVKSFFLYKLANIEPVSGENNLIPRKRLKAIQEIFKILFEDAKTFHYFKKNLEQRPS